MASEVILDGNKANLPAVAIVFAQRVASGDATEAECRYMEKMLTVAADCGWGGRPVPNVMTRRLPPPVRCK